MLPNQIYYEREEIRVITYVNSKDAELFNLAAEQLGIQKGDLSLKEYLNRLSELKAKSPRFVRLPLYEEGHEDEEIFLINANERTIKIPSSFSKNGIGIVSDELAEILWFKINRYFDIKDFGKAVDISDRLNDGDLHILIQWEAPDGAKGASWAYAIDTETDDDYIYFGWAITAEHLTAKAGNIRFAIRIIQYEYDGAEKIAYSFATQAAAVAVKANLSFDLTEDGVAFEYVNDKIASRLMQGQIAHCPVFAEDGDLKAYVIDLKVPDEDPSAPAQAVLEVNAAAPDGESYDAMAYKWYKKGANDEEFKQIEGEYSPALTVTSSGQYYVVVFGMKEIVDNKEFIYDGVSEEVLYTEDDLAAYKEEHGEDAEPAWAVGDVKIPAKTHYDKFKYHTSVASTKSTVCEIPAPIKLEIQPFVDPEDATKILGYMARKFVIGKDGQLEVLVNRQKIGEAVVGDVELRFEKTATAEKDLDLESAEFLPVDLSSTPGEEAVAEAWILNEVEYATEEEAKAAADAAQSAEAGAGDYSGIVHREAKEAVPAVEAPITYEVNDAGEIAIDMAKAEEGYYKVYVVNKLNGDEEVTLSFNKKPEGGVEKVEDATCRVVKPASLKSAEIAIVGEPGPDGRGSRTNGNYLEVSIDLDGQLSDEIKYAWYIINTGKDPADAEPDELIEGADKFTYKPVERGSYYCVVTNIVEDTEAKIITNDIEFA